MSEPPKVCQRSEHLLYKDRPQFWVFVLKSVLVLFNQLVQRLPLGELFRVAKPEHLNYVCSAEPLDVRFQLLVGHRVRYV